MIKRILVGIDFSEASKQALGAAHDWGKRLGVSVKAMHVLQPPAPMVPEAEVVSSMDASWQGSVEAHAKEQLELWAKDFPGVETLVAWGSPAEKLVAEADAETLMVVAHVGHSAFERILFGSTAVKVVKHAPCDVLVVRQPLAKSR